MQRLELVDFLDSLYKL